MLQYGKLIIWNNKLYCGDNSNVPTPIQSDIDLSNYVTKDTLSTYTRFENGEFTGTGTLAWNQFRHIDLLFSPKIIYVHRRTGNGTAEQPHTALTFFIYWNYIHNYRPNTFVCDSASSDTVRYTSSDSTIFDINGDETGFEVGYRLDALDTSYLYLAIG